MSTRDQNNAPVMYGVSHLDGLTPVKIKFNSLRGIMVDSTTSIAFDPSVVPNRNALTALPFATGTSIDDDATILPWVVNASTGAVLIDM